MNTYRELVYMVLDQLKGMSDDFDFTEDHVIFLLSKFRGYLLKQKYADIRKEIPDIDYQTICLDLQEVPAISGEPCEGGSYLRSVQKIPYTMVIGNPMVYPIIKNHSLFANCSQNHNAINYNKLCLYTDDNC